MSNGTSPGSFPQERNLNKQRLTQNEMMAMKLRSTVEEEII